MIGTGVSISSAPPSGSAVSIVSEHFNPVMPVNIPINGFGTGRHIRIVGVPAPNAYRFSRFNVDLTTPTDIAFHFNPRFDQRCVVRNNTRNSQWQHEERFADNFPFAHGQMFTLDFVSEGRYIDVLYNGRLFTRFQERDDPNHIRTVQVEGDVLVHSIHVSSN